MDGHLPKSVFSYPKLTDFTSHAMEQKWDCKIINGTAILSRSWTTDRIFTLHLDEFEKITNIESTILFPDEESLLNHVSWILNATIGQKYTNAIEVIGFKNSWSLLGQDTFHERDIAQFGQEFGGGIPSPFSWLPDDSTINEVNLT